MRKRQKYIDAESYRNTISYLDGAKKFCNEILAKPEVQTGDHAVALEGLALDLWRKFQINYTAGADLKELAILLGEIIDAYDVYVKKNRQLAEDGYYPPFILNDMIDVYVDFLNIFSAAILLHREDLLPVIFSWVADGEYDGTDAVLEELLNFYFADRPSPDNWLWKQPYQKLLDVIDAEKSVDRPKLMSKYVKAWYPSMKGKAGFWGKHEKIKPELSPYFGYWAMCAGSFTYLLGIDDSSYRDEEVYPRDMVDYARSLARRPVKAQDGSEILRAEGGQACPREGTWFSPVENNSARCFKLGEVMPAFDSSEYGRILWQWIPRA